MQIGITERGDAALDTSWLPWVINKKPAILISKNVWLLNEILQQTFEEVPNIIAHTTITGFGGTILEPNVLNYEKSLEGYKSLVDFLGSDRVVLRVDPVIPTEKGIDTARKVIEAAKEIAETRVRISFIDNYDHVKKRFKELDICLPWDTFHAPLSDRIHAWEQLGKPEVCGEPDFECTGCVSEIDCKVLDVQSIDISKGQRKNCACCANKYELLKIRSVCKHACIYCYWQG
jgi:DNA repair photolyase